MNNREAAYKHFMQHEIRIGSAYSDVFYAGFDAALASQAQQPAGWQRRLKFATNGQVHQWELCKTSEATDNFERSPHHEYRQIFTMQSQAQQTESKPAKLERRIKRLSERLEAYKEEYYGKEQILTYHAGYSIGYVEGQLSILEDIPPAPEGGE